MSKKSKKVDNEKDFIDSDIILSDDYEQNNDELENEDIENIKIEEIEDIDDKDFDILYKYNTNKHKQEGKHALNEDTIFKGKNKKEGEEVNVESNLDKFYISYEAGSSYDFESKSHFEYINNVNLANDVYDLLREKTNVDFSQTRRKPNKETFNAYFNLLYNELKFKYTRYEIFVELAYYFTDNIYNMFKLLDKKIISLIIKEMIQSGYLKNLENIKFV